MGGIQTAIELHDNFSGVLYNVCGAVNLAISSMLDMQDTMSSDMDLPSLEGAREQINSAAAALEAMNESIRNMPSPQVQAPDQETVHWQSDPLPVFDGSGVERYRQEIQSTNAMLQQLSSTQDGISRQALHMDLLPPEAFQDINSLSVRIDHLRDRIQTISENPVNMGTEAANAGLEQLRSQLDSAVRQQEDLNTAMESGDLSAVNSAYLRLSQTVSSTERYIRDNTDEQGRFNRQIRDGTSASNSLMNSVKGIAAAYISVQSMKGTLNLSDELTQITARLEMMGQGFETAGMSGQELMKQVYLSAQNARGSLSDMADVVARFGNNARDAFESPKEVIDFANLVQKQMAIAGASTQEAANAELQLSQALGSGVLRGDELNSIFEQAPNLIQNIADYLDVPIGKIREMASEGELSADVVKASIFSASDEINEKFSQMPMTWGQLWQSFQNSATIAFQPVLQRLNDMANSPGFQNFVNNAINALELLSDIALNVLDGIGAAAGFIADNWSWIAPIIGGVVAALAAYVTIATIVAVINGVIATSHAVHAAAEMLATGATIAETAAQHGLNAALLACPITWIILLIIALVALFYAAVAAINKFAGTSISATGIICGAFMVAAAFIGNLFVALINFAIDIFAVLWNFIAAFVNFFGNVFNDPVGAIARLFFDLADTVLGILEALASAIDSVFGSNLAGAVSGWRDSLSGWVDKTFDKGDEIMSKMNGSDYHIDRFSYSDAWDAGYSFGEGIDKSISNFDPSSLFGTDNIPSPEDYANTYKGSDTGGGTQAAQTAANTGQTAANTAAIADSLDVSNEQLKYLRDVAERDTINRFTTASIKVEMTNNNNVSSNMDLDGIVDSLTSAVEDAMSKSASGVHH